MINSDGQRANCKSPVAVLASEIACTSFARVEAVLSRIELGTQSQPPAISWQFPITSLRISGLTDVTHPGILPNVSRMSHLG